MVMLDKNPNGAGCLPARTQWDKRDLAGDRIPNSKLEPRSGTGQATTLRPSRRDPLAALAIFSRPHVGQVP